jgi:hypothetical protein
LIDANIDNIDELLIDMGKKKEKQIKLFVVDYIQLINASGKGNRVEQIEYVARKLRRGAIAHEAITLGISQLSRQHARDKTEPDLHDLKGSGGLENDATQVIFIKTKRYNDIVSGKDVFLPPYREAILSVKKNRHGKSGEDVRCIVRPDLYKFINVDFSDATTELSEVACTKCNGEEFYVDKGGECYCGACNLRYTTDCEDCGNSGYIEYKKTFDGINYNYIGLCSKCARGQGLRASIMATNSVIDTPQDKITILPFVGSNKITGLSL